MKYYAVTDDPNELIHWGIKGMKWGVRRTDAQLGHPRHTGSKRPRSAAYKRAQSKLSAAMRNGIKAIEKKWKVYNSPVNKQIRAEKRYERQTNRAIEKARKGKLKYGKLTDDQVYRITERLALERNARELSNREQTFRHRLAKSIGEGVVTGIGQGFGRKASEWIARGSTLKTDRMRMEQQDRLNREFSKRNNSRKELKRKAKQAVNEEYYKTVYEEGDDPSSFVLSRNRAQYLADVKKRNKASDYSSAIKKVYDETEARQRAINDARVVDDNSRAIRAHSNERKLEGTSAVARLNAWNEAHENVNKHGNAYLDSVDNAKAITKARQARETERKFVTNELLRDYAKTQKQRAQEEAVRRNIAQQKEQARLARANEIKNKRSMTKATEVKGNPPTSDDFERRKNDLRNTSNYRKKRRK